VRIRVSTEINSTPEQVWDLMCNAHRYPEWVTVTDRMVEAPDGPVGAGSVYREYGGIPPFKGESRWEVIEFEPTRRQVHVGDDGSMTMHLEILIEPAPNGTLLTQNLEFTPRWWLRPMAMLMWPLLMGRRGKAAIVQTQANAKRLLESAGAAAQAQGGPN